MPIYINSKYFSEEDYSDIVDFFTNEVAEGSAINVLGIMSSFGYSRPYSPQVQVYDKENITNSGIFYAISKERYQ